MRETKRAKLTVEAPVGSRWLAGIEMIQEGAMVLLGDLMLYLERGKSGRLEEASPFVVEADASTWWHRSDSQSRKKLARGTLLGARETLEELMHSSPDLAATLEGRSVKYELVDDYGDGAVLLCTLQGDQLTDPEAEESDFRP